MCAKSRRIPHGGVRSTAALAGLQTFIDAHDASTRAKGQDYFRGANVIEAHAGGDDLVLATVEGRDVYEVELHLADEGWSAICSCPVGTRCKHVVAAGLAWLATEGNDFDLEADDEFAADDEPEDWMPSLQPKPVAPIPKPRGPSFRDKWAPIAAEKLGRALTSDEARQLGQLSALYHEAVGSFTGLTSGMVRQHGFGDALPPNAPPWGPIFKDWIDRDAPPPDPWALWQYLAYSLEVQGKPIPEVFRPFTNTDAVHAALDARLANQQLHAWRSAFGTSTDAGGWTRPTLAKEGVAGLRIRLSEGGVFHLEVRAAPNKPWKRPSTRAAAAISRVQPADLEALSPAERALAITLILTDRSNNLHYRVESVDAEAIGAALRSPEARAAIVLPDERPFAVEPEPLVPEATVAAHGRERLSVQLVRPDGAPAVGAKPILISPEPLYWHDGRVWRGPPPLPAAELPFTALGDPVLMRKLRSIGLRLPQSLEVKRRTVTLRPLLRITTADQGGGFEEVLRMTLLARSADPACEQEWRGRGGWTWTENGAPPPRRPDDPILEFDREAADAVGASFAQLRLYWDEFARAWTRVLTRTFPDEAAAWRASLPGNVDIEVTPELAGLFGAPLRASVDFSAIARDAAHDWFDLTVALRVEDTTLTPDEIALLVKARGKWVRLPKRGWQRLEVATDGGERAPDAVLDRLGLTAADVWATGKAVTHRVHALQLAAEADAVAAHDAALARVLRERSAALQARPAPAVPSNLTATLRPYQQEGFHFLAHLSSNGFGGVLADDMGLGKTVQALAWLLHLRSESGDGARNFRALVVCPKSVMHGWLAEAARFAPSLRAVAFTPELMEKPVAKTALMVANYTQLRLHAEWFRGGDWTAAILDEGQFIKNPSSQVAAAARELPAPHRLVLTGTPVENRLSDLWSLFAFAQPGLLGNQAAFRRQYDEKDPAALMRVHRRVRHFLLRRTKGQAAPDLPPRTEDELLVELEPAQRKLYDAELKRARQQLLGIETARALDKVRFNVLASLLRLRQICCHPALLDPAHAALPSAKLEALIERIEELRDEGHQVLVFSQFVEMLELIQARLAAADIGHLLLTGATENRAKLTETFQTDRSKTVFLLSLKAAGFGLNLTAASYAILFDPWWNPAVEAQAIDRTHRIGQTKPVIAYRLIAKDTVEQKIRALQQEKAALAAAVVQEESLAQVLDLESLRQILG